MWGSRLKYFKTWWPPRHGDATGSPGRRPVVVVAPGPAATESESESHCLAVSALVCQGCGRARGFRHMTFACLCSGNPPGPFESPAAAAAGLPPGAPSGPPAILPPQKLFLITGTCNATGSSGTARAMGPQRRLWLFCAAGAAASGSARRPGPQPF